MSADTAVPGLELVGATRRFAGAQKVTALDSVTLKIEPGEMVGIVGRSGSGKSSLLHVLGLLDVLSAGVYTIAGRDAAALRESERAAMRARTFGFVFQNPHLLASRNARENVELALGPQRCRGEDRRRRAVEALSAVGLEHRLWAFPNTLSGGEAQRLVIARVVAQRMDSAHPQRKRLLVLVQLAQHVLRRHVIDRAVQPEDDSPPG